MDVLYSVRPEWCKLILEGRKTSEVRKTLPIKLVPTHMPFTGYIYCTKGTKALITKENIYFLVDWNTVDVWKNKGFEVINGRVVACFECWNIAPINKHYLFAYERVHFDETQIPRNDLEKYIGSACAYAIFFDYLHNFVSKLTLENFYKPGYKEKIKKAPQSWCYVDSLRIGD